MSEKIEFVDKGATFSPCRKYRYTLWREWDFGEGTINFLLLNPSTADENVLDPTLTRCLKFSQSWGFRKMVITNIFAYRATDPNDMKAQIDPIGPENDKYILDTAKKCDKVVVGYGNHNIYLSRGFLVESLLERESIELHCLGVNRTGFPKHPLYLKSNLLPVRYCS